jgi:hypothetical protein
MNDPTDYLQRILSELHDIERLMYKGYEFDITGYNINGGDDMQNSLIDVIGHISSTRPSRQSLKLIVVRTG